jgi:hypothetical protein
MSAASDNKPETKVEIKPALAPEKKRRNLFVLLALLFFVLIVYAVTMIKIGTGTMH